LECRSGNSEGTGAGGTPSKPKSSKGGEEEDEYEEDGEVTPPRHSPPPEDLHSLSDIFSQQVGIFIGTCRPKHLWTGIGPSSGLQL
jgi:hypothetical protein